MTEKDNNQHILPLKDFNSIKFKREISLGGTNGQANKVSPQDKMFHEWYRFVLSFPPHLVRQYIDNFGLDKGSTILDPFCGTGTTIVESKLNGIQSIGIEANPMAYFASSIKVDWDIDSSGLIEFAKGIAEKADALLKAQGIDDNRPLEMDIPGNSLKTLDPESYKLLLTNSISPLPLHKTLTLLDCIKEYQNERYYKHTLLALAKALVFTISNLRFGPEIGVGKPKKDAQVIALWLLEVRNMSNDLRLVQSKPYPFSKVILGDSRDIISNILEPNSIDAIITSPPYPNEKDYTRITRLESVILGLINNKKELRKFKKNFIRSNTRNVYKGDDDDNWVADNVDIQKISQEIEEKRLELGKNSGFEKLYGKVTKLYFGGMARHFADLRKVLRPGAQLAYVVGDQASYLRVMIRTGQLIAQIAENLGFEVVRIDLFRTRFSTATKEQLREEVVILKWPGHKE